MRGFLRDHNEGPGGFHECPWHQRTNPITDRDADTDHGFNRRGFASTLEHVTVTESAGNIEMLAHQPANANRPDTPNIRSHPPVDGGFLPDSWPIGFPGLFGMHTQHRFSEMPSAKKLMTASVKPSLHRMMAPCVVSYWTMNHPKSLDTRPFSSFNKHHDALIDRDVGMDHGLGFCEFHSCDRS